MTKTFKIIINNLDPTSVNIIKIDQYDIYCSLKFNNNSKYLIIANALINLINGYIIFKMYSGEITESSRRAALGREKGFDFRYFF